MSWATIDKEIINAEVCDALGGRLRLFPGVGTRLSPTSPVTLHRDEPLDVSVFFDNRPADATPLQLYAGDKLVHSARASRHGRLLLGLLPVGKYRVVIPHKGTLDVVILPQTTGLNGDMISWFLFPKSRYKWVEGKQVPGKPCPVVVLKAD